MSDEKTQASHEERGRATPTGREQAMPDHLLPALEAQFEERERLIEAEALNLQEEALRLSAEHSEAMSDDPRLREKADLLRQNLARTLEEIERLAAERQQAHEMETARRDVLVRNANKISRTKKPTRGKVARPAGPRTVTRAVFALELLGDAVPKRINTEEIGDALERIHQLAAKGRPTWVIYLKVVTTYWWVFVNTLLHYGERVAGIVKVAIGKGDTKE